MILEIYFFAFLFVFGLFLYGMAVYLKTINENEMSFCRYILYVPLICIMFVVITRYWEVKIMKFVLKRYREDIFELSDEKLQELKEIKINQIKEDKELLQNTTSEQITNHLENINNNNIFSNITDLEILEYIVLEGKHIEVIDSGYDEKEPCLKHEDVYKK